MKPCAQFQQPIALLAFGVVKGDTRHSLVAHMENCEGCRQYFEGMSALTKSFNGLQVVAEAQMASSFHQRLMQRLDAEAPVSLWDRLAHQVRLHWRAALPVVAVATLVLIVLLPSSRAPMDVPQPPGPVATDSGPSVQLAPTIANYQQVANRSIDELNDLLNRQGRQNLPAAPVYIAGSIY